MSVSPSVDNSLHSSPVSHNAVRQVGIRQRSLRRHCRLGRATELVFILVTGATLTLAGGAEAQTWDGSTNTNWAVGPNWTPSGVPVAGDTVTINNGALSNQPSVIDARSAAQVNVSAGTLTITGTGALTAPVAVANTGALVIQAGGSVIGSVDAVGASASNAGTITGILTVGAGTFDNSGVVTGTTTVAGGTLNLNTGSNLADAQALTVNGGTVNVNADDTVGELSGTGGELVFTAGNGLTVNQATDTTFAGAISGATNTQDPYLVKDGVGTLTLSGANTTTGAGNVQILGGTLAVQGGNAIGDNNIVEANTGTFELLANETAGALLIISAGTVDLNANTLTLAGPGFAIEAISDGGITGTGGFAINGSGFTQTFTSANTYTGDTTITAGTLQLGASDIIDDASDVIVNGGTLAMQAFDDTVASVSLQSGSITGTGTLTSAGTYDQSGGTLDSGVTVNAGGAKALSGGTIAGTLGGAGATTVQGGTATVTGTIDGNVTVAAGGTLRIESATAVSGSITTTGSVVSLGDGQNEASNLIISSATTDLEVLSGEAAEYSGVISSTDAFGFEKVGTGNLTVSGANTYTGVTTVSEGTLTLASSNGLGAAGAGNETTVASGATLAAQGGVGTAEAITLNGTGVGGGGALRNVSGNNVFSGTVTLGSATRINSDAGQLQIDGDVTGTNVNLTVGGVSTTLINGDITTGTGSLTVDATGAGGVVSLTGTNTFTGGTTVNSGFLQLGGGAALADSGALTVNAPGTVQVLAGETVGALSGDGTITLQTAGALVAGGSTNTEFSGVIGEFGATGPLPRQAAAR